ncbi:hypothetical protein LshimejAT787_0210620 [Lyophyllum shimeji]|uniref:WD40 repeat-like protein n=1 Tax=Lyophyllum shimeji TaxID=47721 RepID=A0A9P3PGA2_LYOSH|nr:hypothetical protein LshimejAT787_0210620 [Lyophyllum shimeji]
MDDSSVTDSDTFALGPSVASILGIQGNLRFRPHGSTQKAHVILRRVTVQEDSSDDGEVCNVVRFSLFAQKRIEVKPGKEILLTVASPDGRFKDLPVVLEGDLLSAEDTSDGEDDTQVADEEDIFLPPAGEAIPPKMRRAWTKKADDVSLVISSPERPASTRSSIGIQVQPSCTSRSSQTHTTSVSASVQVDPLPPIRTSSAVQTKETRRYMSSDAQTDGALAESDLNDEAGSLLSKVRTDLKRERSLSPMELDSPPDSPRLSPRGSSQGGQTPIFSPTIVPDLIAKLDLPPEQSSAPLDMSSLGARDMQLSPIESEPSLQAVGPLASEIHLAQPGLSNAEDIDAQRHLESERLYSPAASSTQTAEPLRETASRMASPVAGTKAPAKPAVHPGKSDIRNPFVSAGFMTEFVAPVEKLLPQDNPTVVSTPVKVESTDSKPSTPCGVSLLDRMSVDAPPSPPPATSSSSKPGVAQSLSIQQNAVASSSKYVLRGLTRAKDFPEMLIPELAALQGIPTGPRACRPESARAFEKSPAATVGLGLQPQAHSATKRSSPPPDPKSLIYIPSGPSSNPLNIRPATVASRGTPKVPTAPKMLAQTPATAKKRVVVGAGWPFVKATNGTGPSAAVPPTTPTAPSQTPPAPELAPSQTTGLSNIIPYSSPSPPAAAPAPLPASAPQNKWKRVNGDLAPTPAPNDLVSSSAPATPCPPGVDVKQKKGQTAEKVRKTSLPEKPRPMSLKDRITDPSGGAPTEPTPSTPPATTNGRDLRSRISDAPPLPNLQTTSPVTGRRSTTETKKPSLSPVVTRTSALPSTLPAPPATPTSSTPMTHPLPPKPVQAAASSSRGIKRERPKSPDSTPESGKGKKRRFRWSTVDSNYSTRLHGEGQLGILSIAFSSDGTHFALSCADRTIRIWNGWKRIEIARLAHNSLVVAVSWMDGDAGVVSLGEDGLVSKWTKSGVNHWQWAKVLDAGKNDRRSDDDQVCLAYMRDRVAVSFPRSGVKVWMWLKGTWQSQRSILRQNVTAIRFVDDGAALIGGTRDGVLWYCEVPNGTLRAYAFLKSKIQSLDLTPSGSHVLAANNPTLVRRRKPGQAEDSALYLRRRARLSCSEVWRDVFLCGIGRGVPLFMGSSTMKVKLSRPLLVSMVRRIEKDISLRARSQGSLRGGRSLSQPHAPRRLPNEPNSSHDATRRTVSDSQLANSIAHPSLLLLPLFIPARALLVL